MLIHFACFCRLNGSLSHVFAVTVHKQTDFQRGLCGKSCHSRGTIDLRTRECVRNLAEIGCPNVFVSKEKVFITPPLLGEFHAAHWCQQLYHGGFSRGFSGIL